MSNSDTHDTSILTDDQVTFYGANGYLVVPSLFTVSACREIVGSAIRLHGLGSVAGCFEAVEESEADGDILKVYPRMMHPHRIDDVFMKHLKHPGVSRIVQALLDQEAVDIQSMFYWKPPGAMGQAFHQDSFFVQGEPDTCIAAWTALEETDEDNGGLIVVEGTQEADLLEMRPIDSDKYFSTEAVSPPVGVIQTTVRLKAGDTLFFGGHLIHGSEPNNSTDRFRQSLICHYVASNTETMSESYKPTVPLE